MTKPLSDSVCIVRGCGNPSQMPDSEYCASCAATPNAEILAAWRAAIENWDGPDIEDANYSPAMFAAGFEAGRAAVPRAALRAGRERVEEVIAELQTKRGHDGSEESTAYHVALSNVHGALWDCLDGHKLHDAATGQKEE